MNKLLSIVVIGKNESSTLESCLSQCQKIAKDIIYVDSNSTDDSVEIAKKYARKVIGLEGELSAAIGRNAGSRYCTNEYILFIDGDVIISKEFITFISKDAYQAKDICFGWKKDIVKNKISFHAPKAYISSPDFLGGNFIIRRKIFKTLGGFNETLAAEEEREFLLRAYHAGVSAAQFNIYMGDHINNKKSSRGIAARYFNLRSYSLIWVFLNRVSSYKGWYKVFWRYILYTLSIVLILLSQFGCFVCGLGWLTLFFISLLFLKYKQKGRFLFFFYLISYLFMKRKMSFSIQKKYSVKKL